MKPFLKWAGGKTQLLPELLARTPKTFGRYFEPFVGGGALFFALHDNGRLAASGGAYLNDANEKLITTYTAVRDHVDEVFGNLTVDEYNEGSKEKQREIFDVVRRLFNANDGPPALRAARFIFLNKTCFNGLYRENRSGEFNVPFGDRLLSIDTNGIRECSRALQTAVLSSHDFEVAVSDSKEGDFVYFDPPYVPVSATSNFSAYQKEGFGPKEQTRLRDVARRLKERGVHVLLSNADVSFVRDLYSSPFFVIDRVEARRNINSKGDRRGAVGELLIT